MIILNSVEYFNLLEALFLVCVEEARCLLFHYNADRQSVLAVGRQPVVGNSHSAAEAPLSLV